MCRKILSQTPYWSLALGPQWGFPNSDPPASLTAFSCNESRLCFSNHVCSAPNSWGTRGTDSWLDNTDKNLVPDLPILLKMHEIWSVDSQENY